MAVHLAVAGDLFGGILFCSVLFPFNEMSWVRSGTELSPFLRIFPTYFRKLAKLEKWQFCQNLNFRLNPSFSLFY